MVEVRIRVSDSVKVRVRVRVREYRDTWRRLQERSKISPHVSLLFLTVLQGAWRYRSQPVNVQLELG